MEEESTVSLEFTDEEIERILMSLTLARNSPQMSGSLAVDDLIARFAAHADESAIPVVDDPAADLRADYFYAGASPRASVLANGRSVTGSLRSPRFSSRGHDGVRVPSRDGGFASPNRHAWAA